jgi:hypothetical protein
VILLRSEKQIPCSFATYYLECYIALDCIVNFLTKIQQILEKSRVLDYKINFHKLKHVTFIWNMISRWWYFLQSNTNEYFYKVTRLLFSWQRSKKNTIVPIHENTDWIPFVTCWFVFFTVKGINFAASWLQRQSEEIIHILANFPSTWAVKNHHHFNPH